MVEPVTSALIVGGSLLGSSLLGNKAANKSANRQIQAQQDALAQAEQIQIQLDQIARDGAAKAEALIAEGMEASAAAIMKGSKQAINFLEELTGRSVEEQKASQAKIDAIFAPTIAQGRFAADEIASMLGIKNSEGQLIPFDIDKLTKIGGKPLPAFQAGIRAVENSAVGKKLSTEQAERAASFGADFFGQRVNQLEPVANRGASAESINAQLQGQTGRNIGNTLFNSGQAGANIFKQRGVDLGRVFLSSTLGQAGISGDLTQALLGTAGGLGQAQIQSTINQGNINAGRPSTASTLSELLQLGALIGFNGLFNKAPDPTGAGLGLNSPPSGAFRTDFTGR